MNDKYEGLLNFNTTTDFNFKSSLSSPDETIFKIKEIDQLFVDCFEVVNTADNLREIFFIHRSRSLFLSAARIGLGGQSPDVYPLTRALLESALYAWFIKQETGRFEIWINRLRGGESRKAARKLFLIGKILSDFEADNPAIGRVIKEIYEFHIDFGAHPNPSGVISGSSIIDHDSSTILSMNLTHRWDMDSYHLAIKEIARTAIGSLEIYRCMFPEKFRLLGFDQRIAQVMQDL